MRSGTVSKGPFMKHDGYVRVQIPFKYFGIPFSTKKSIIAQW